jgi:prevent-host-death family protein
MSRSTTFAVAEAKAKLSELLDRVVNGEEITITRHDEAVAKLVPAKRPSREKIKRAIAEMKELRKGSRVTTEELIAWKNQGRP